jgi:hypothetical protein
MIYPVWPLFVTSFLGANAAVLWLIDGMYAALSSDAFLNNLKKPKANLCAYIGFL